MLEDFQVLEYTSGDTQKGIIGGMVRGCTDYSLPFTIAVIAVIASILALYLGSVIVLPVAPMTACPSKRIGRGSCEHIMCGVEMSFPVSLSNVTQRAFFGLFGEFLLKARDGHFVESETTESWIPQIEKLLSLVPMTPMFESVMVPP